MKKNLKKASLVALITFMTSPAFAGGVKIEEGLVEVPCLTGEEAQIDIDYNNIDKVDALVKAQLAFDLSAVDALRPLKGDERVSAMVAYQAEMRKFAEKIAEEGRCPSKDL